MEYKLFLYIDNDGLVTHASCDKLDIENHDSFSILGDDQSIIELRQLAEIDKNLYGRKFKLNQNEKGQYFLKKVFYVYYKNNDEIISLSPKPNPEFDNNLKCRIVFENKEIEEISNGKKSLLYFRVEEKGKKYALLKEKIFKSNLWEAKNIYNYRLNQPINGAKHIFIYSRKEKLITIQATVRFQIEFFWCIITRKNDPTIVYYVADETVLSKDYIINLLNVPDLPETFDIFSSLSTKNDYDFREK